MTKPLADLYLDTLILAPTDGAHGDLETGAWLGRIWPDRALPMIGVPRLANILHAVRTVIDEHVPGDLIETGVWRGGATILMRAALEAYGGLGRSVWVADSFAGLPHPDAATYPHDANDTHHTFAKLAVPIDEVRANFERFGLLDGRVRFLKGWFRDTLPTAPIERLAVLRLDGDIYESTVLALEHLAPKVSSGGFIIIDDYVSHEPKCGQAVRDYRAAQGITAPLVPIDWTGVYWRTE